MGSSMCTRTMTANRGLCDPAKEWLVSGKTLNGWAFWCGSLTAWELEGQRGVAARTGSDAFHVVMKDPAFAYSQPCG